MRVAKPFESGIATVRAARVRVRSRWRRWAERVFERATRRLHGWPLDRVHLRPRMPRTADRLHTVTRIAPFRSSIQLHLTFTNRWQQTVVAARVEPTSQSRPDTSRLIAPRRRLTTLESIAVSVRHHLHVTNYRRETIEGVHAVAERWERIRSERQQRTTELIEQLRRRSERVPGELPARIVHRNPDAAFVRTHNEAAVAPVGPRALGPASRAAESALQRAGSSPGAEAPFGLDLRRVTDEVVRQIDRRLLARRERMGQV